MQPSGQGGYWDRPEYSEKKCPFFTAPEVDEDTTFTMHLIVTKGEEWPPNETRAEIEVIVENTDS